MAVDKGAKGISVGKRSIRVDAEEKVRGEGIYTADLRFPGMLYAKLKQSEHAHAKILSVDTTEAEELPGVKGVFTARDVPGMNTVGLIVADQPVFADKKVCHYGDGIAMVVAESPEIAERGVDLIKVSYEELPGVFDPEEAMKDDALLVHPDGEYGNDGNVLSRMGFDNGDVDMGFEEADVIVEDVYRPGYQEHAFLETEGCIVLSDGENITVYGSLQCPFYVRDAISKALDIQSSKVRVVQVALGGAFGGKEDVPSELAARTAIAARRFKRPVMNVRKREGSMTIHTKRHPMIIRSRVGVRKDGSLTAAEVDIVSDQGAYCSVGKYVQKRAVVHACGAYRIPNVKVSSALVYTNNILTGAFRGFGAPQVTMAMEQQMDRLAGKLGFDPVEFRRRNMVRKGDVTPKGQVLDNCGDGLEQCIEKATSLCGWGKRRKEFEEFNRRMERGGEIGGANLRKGLGVSAIMYGVGLGDSTPDMATATCQITEDGSAIITTGGVEMGQGAKTALSQIAAEEIGVPLDHITILDADTAIVQNSGPSVASRITPIIGEATRRAAENAVAAVREVAAERLNVEKVKPFIDTDGIPYLVPDDRPGNTGDIRGDPGGPDESGMGEETDPGAESKDRTGNEGGGGTNEKIPYHDTVRECYGLAKRLLGLGYCRTPTLLEDGSYRDYYTYSFACHIAEVEVDLDTGKVKVDRIIAANDVGKAINPTGVEGQMEGGAVQGMGYALTEGLVTEEGRILNPSFTDYLIPTSLDAPEILTAIIEEKDEFGPFGAKGIGEPSLIPTPAAVLNAVSHAIGRPFKMTPATPENVWKALREGK